MIAQISGAQALDIDNNLTDGYIGLMPEVVCAAPRYSTDIGVMPEVVVTAPRYEGEDIAYSGMMSEIVVTALRYGADIGMMPEVVVTAPRYEGEDIAYSGMMPEIVVNAPRSGEIDTKPSYMVVKERVPQTSQTIQLLLIDNSDSSEKCYLN